MRLGMLSMLQIGRRCYSFISQTPTEKRKRESESSYPWGRARFCPFVFIVAWTFCRKEEKLISKLKYPKVH